MPVFLLSPAKAIDDAAPDGGAVAASAHDPALGGSTRELLDVCTKLPAAKVWLDTSHATTLTLSLTLSPNSKP